MSIEDAIIVAEANEPSTFHFPCAGGNAHIFSARSSSLEGTNEDAAAVYRVGKDRAVLVVADGLGGLPNGGHASKLAIEAVGKALTEYAFGQEGLRPAILNGIEAANKELLETGGGSGTTLALVEIGPEGARPYHIGDSVIYQIGGQGKLKWQTISHSPVGYGVAAGMIDEAKAITHDERHLISNMIGAPDMRIEIGPYLQLAQKDTLLLASDGLSDNVHLDEILEFCRKGKLEEALELLATMALDRMDGTGTESPSKPDDCSLILFRTS